MAFIFRFRARHLADQIENAVAISYEKLLGSPVVPYTVVGELVLGYLQGVPVVCDGRGFLPEGRG